MFRRPLVIIAVVLVLGILIIKRWETAASFFEAFLSPVLRREMEENGEKEREAVLTGTVTGVIDKEGKTIILLHCDRKTVGGVRVYVDPEEAGEEGTGAALSKRTDVTELPMIGSRITVSGRLFLFDCSTVPGVFSVRSYYDSVGYYYGMTDPEISVMSGPVLMLPEYVNRWKRSLSKSISAYAAPETAGYLKLLLFAEKDEALSETEELFGSTDMIRLLRLSGAGLTLAAGAVYRLLRRLFRSLPRCAFFSILFLMLYVIATGSTVSGLRALIVFSVRAMAPVMKRRFDLLNAFSLSLILLVLHFPACAETAAIQYSAAAAFAGGVIFPCVNAVLKRYHPVYTPVIRMLSFWCCFLPVILYHNYELSITGMLLSSLFSMLTGIVMLTGLFGAVAGTAALSKASEFFFGTAHFVLKTEKLAALAASKHGALSFYTGCPGAIRSLVYLAVLAAAAGLFRFLFLWRKQKSARLEIRIDDRHYRRVILILSAVFLFGLLVLHAPKVASSDCEVIMCDVGQGDCILIRTGAGGCYLVDAGSSSVSEAAEERILPMLKFYGIRSLDGVFLSHPDADHVNAVTGLMESSLSIDLLILTDTSETRAEMADIIEEAGTQDIPVLYVSAGNVLRGKGCEFEVLWPECEEDQNGGSVTKNGYSGNEASMVLLFHSNGFTALFTGDIGSSVEMQAARAADLLKVAHHGSAYSTSEAFLSVVTPEVAIVSCAERNSYGHPAPALMGRLESAGAETPVTATCGTVIVRADPRGIREVLYYA